MARINLWETVVNGSGAPVSVASVDVWLARTTTDATIYAAETGPGTLANPVTTTNGTIPGWVDEGEYDLHVTGVGITTTDKRFNAVLGGNPAKAADSITSAEIGADQVGTSEIAPGAVTSAELAADSVIAGKIAAGAISQSSDFAASVVDATALAANAVTSGKIAANAVIAGKLANASIDTSARFAADVVDAAAIAPDAVGATELAANAVDNAAIQVGVINPSKFDFSATGNLIGQVVGTGGGTQGPLNATFTNLTGITSTHNLTTANNNFTLLAFAQVHCKVSGASAGVDVFETIEVRWTLDGAAIPVEGRFGCKLRNDGAGITDYVEGTIVLACGLTLTLGSSYVLRLQARVNAADANTDSTVNLENTGYNYILLGQ